jgi:hypothetical protein
VGVLPSVFLKVVQSALVLVLEVNDLLVLELDICLQGFDLLSLFDNTVFEVVVFNLVVVTNPVRLFNLIAGRYLYLLQGSLLFVNGSLLFKKISFVLFKGRP